MTQSRTGREERGASRKFWKTDAFNTLCDLTQGAGQSSLEHEAPLAAPRTYQSGTSDSCSAGRSLISYVITVIYLSKPKRRLHAWHGCERERLGGDGESQRTSLS